MIARETAYALGDHVRVATGSGIGSVAYENRVVRGTTAAVAPAHETSVGAQATDGTAVFEAMDAWSRSRAVVDVVDRTSYTAEINDPRAVDDWFASGMPRWEGGANAGRSIEVKAWPQATGQL